MLLPVNYFLVTFTLPHELHAVTYAHQRRVYDAMFAASSEALKELAMDRRFLGAHIGMMGVLQTWQRNLDYHPHIHFLVPAGGLTLRTIRLAILTSRHQPPQPAPQPRIPRCPHCGGPMQRIRFFRRNRAPPL